LGKTEPQEMTRTVNIEFKLSDLLELVIAHVKELISAHPEPRLDTEAEYCPPIKKGADQEPLPSPSLDSV
jgi:hypothetical protein